MSISSDFFVTSVIIKRTVDELSTA